MQRYSGRGRLHRSMSRSRIRPVAEPFVGSEKECCHVTNQTHELGAGRSTPDAALIALKKEIAQRYEHAQKEAKARHKLRAAREQERLRRRREGDVG
jgi:hypothetical protein